MSSIVLLEQWKTALDIQLREESVSMLGGGYAKTPDLSRPVTVGVVNTIASISDTPVGDYQLVVADECHRYGSDRNIEALFESAAARLGLTATFDRSDNGVEERLLPYFQNIVFKYGYAQPKKDGVTARFNVLTIGVDLSENDSLAYTAAGKVIGRSKYQLVQGHGHPGSPIGVFMKRAAGGEKTYQEGVLCNNFMQSMRRRKAILSDSAAEHVVVDRLPAAIDCATKTLLFCSTVDAADKFSGTLKQQGVLAKAYYSKLSKSG